MTTVAVRGVELEVDDARTGPAVVWAHGLTSSMEHEDERPLLDIDRLRTAHRLVRYDARGHGRSASTDEPRHDGWNSLALDQLLLADQLDIDRYVAAGASMGAATALNVAVQAPERVSGLVLVIPPTAWESRAAQRDVYRRGADLVDAGRIDVLVDQMRATPPPDPFLGDDDWHDRNERRLRAADPARRGRVLRGAIGADLPAPDDIAAIVAPALILAWTGDPVHPTSTAERLAELLPDARLTVASTDADVAGWTASVLAFLADLP